MKKLFLIALAITSFELSFAQSNTFPGSGFVGIGTTSPVSPLTINYPYAQLRLEGSSSDWYGNDIQLTRSNSSGTWARSPNILFLNSSSGNHFSIQSQEANLRFFSNAQEKLTIGGDGGFVGVNASYPSSPLQVNEGGTNLSIGSANTTSLQGTSYIGFNAQRMTTNVWRFNGNASGDGGAVIFAKQDGTLNFLSVPTLNGTAYKELTDDQVKPYIAMQVTPGGIVRAKRFKVETTGWPDYVFSGNYKLPSLNAVSSFINKNHHLPDMPSASEVHADGQDLGEMNKLLLKKVEELTLYLIEQKTTNDKQQKEIESLKKQMLGKKDK